MKHSKYGEVKVLCVCPTDLGGLARIETEKYGIFWIRASEVGKEEIWTDKK